MKKPDDIPQDIWDRSSMLWGHEPRIGIARAIMAEHIHQNSMVIFMEDMRKYFERLATRSTEDSVLQACLFNAENCRKIADHLRLGSVANA